MLGVIFWLLFPVAVLLIGAGAVFCGLYVGEAIALGRLP